MNNKFEILRNLMISDRSIRRFNNSKSVDINTLYDIVSLTRFCASGRNIQPLKYYLVTNKAICEEIFPFLAWAGYYQDWDGPEPENRPAAYIVQCLDTTIANNPMCDEGLHLQTISLAANALGLGGCIIKSFNVAELARVLNIPDNLKPCYVYALGVPAENAYITDLQPDGDYRYFRDEKDSQCVPKRLIDDVIVKID